MNLTQAELGTLAGMHKDTIYLLENNKALVNVRYILKLETILDCSLAGYDPYYDFARNTSINIKHIRSTLKMSTLEFGNLLGINRNTVYKWENGKSYITRTHFNKITSLKLYDSNIPYI